jgi:hypothetical protein
MKHKSKYVSKGGNEMLKKGDKVVMHTCIEAERHNGRIWTCKTDEFERNGQRLVFLEGFTGCFSAEYLQRVDLSDVYFANEVIKGTLDDYSEKIEELQDELARWEAGLNQTKEMYELQRQLRQAQTKLNSIRFYAENPVPDNKLAEIILNIINDPEHDGI